MTSEALGAAAPGAGAVGERFPFTKFLPPVLDDRVVVEQIVERLTEAVATRRLTVVGAPPGAGKTTALAAWAATSRVPVAWVRMGAADNSPPAVAAALLAGAQRVLDGFGSRLEQMLATQELMVTPQHLVTSLVNDLGEGPAPVLVLDDFHEVTDPEALAFLDGLLDHLPPAVRVVVASRTEPPLSLPRRRVRGEVAELGLDDLRLGPEAIRAALAHEGAAPDALVDAVAAASGGWAAAVRLATALVAADIDGQRDEAAAIARLQEDLWRFLAEEVLGTLPADVRRFLLETAILDDLHPGVCAAVTGRADSAALLAELDRRNLFLARFADEHGQAWRYHDLFAAFLRDHLRAERTADEVAELHRRAAAALPSLRALPHLLEAGAYERVAELAVDLSFQSLDASRLVAVLPTVQALPLDVIEAHPRLALLLALEDEFRGRSSAIRARLEPLYARLRAADDHLAAAEIGLELAAAYLMEGDLGRTAELLDAAVAQPLPPLQHMWAVVVRLHLQRDRGDWSGMSAALAEAFDSAFTIDDPSGPKVLAYGTSFTMLFADQGPAWVVERSRRLAALLAPADTASHTSLRMLLASAALLDLDVDRAVSELHACLEGSAEFGGLAWTQQEAEIMLATAALATGDHETVAQIVEQALVRMPESPIDASLRYAYAYAALRSASLRGGVRRLATLQARLLPPVEAPASPEERIGRAVAAAIVARAERTTAGDTLEALCEAEELQRERRCWLGAGQPGLERASILFAQGRTAAALEAAEPTLATAAAVGAGILLPEAGAHRPLLERCAQAGLQPDLVRAVCAVADRHTAGSAAAVPGTGETLSRREVEVLGHVAEGRSNREIADTLFISEVTVKSHLTRILRKLDATSRTHAVARARDLDLL